MKRRILIGFGLGGLLVIGLGVAFVAAPTTIGISRPEATAQLFTQASIKTPLTAFRIQNGRYPTTQEGLAALAQAPAGLEATWRGPYIDSYRQLIDPWGHPYQYRCPGLHYPEGYDIWSLGPDGRPSADDIGNW